MGTQNAQILYGTDDADIIGCNAGRAGAILGFITKGADVDSTFRCGVPTGSQQYIEIDWE